MKRKRWALILLCALGIGVLSGCRGASVLSGYTEVDDIELVLSLGVDAGEDGAVELTMCTGVGLDAEPPHVYSYKGDTLASALNEFQRSAAGKKTMFSHLENFLIGESVARAGIADYLDYVERTMDIRLATQLFIVKDGTAREMIQGASGEESSATDMLELLRQNVEELGIGHVYDFGEVALRLEETGAALVMAVRQTPGAELPQTEEKSMISPAGFAVLQDGKLKAYVEEEAARGTALMESGVRFGDEKVRDLSGNEITLELIGFSAKFSPVYRGSTLERIDVTAETESNVTELKGDARLSDESERAQIEAALAELMKKRIERAIGAAQELKLDYIGIGGRIQRAAPVKYQKMDPDWETVFPDVEFRITSKAILKRTYDLEDPIPIDGTDKEE